MIRFSDSLDAMHMRKPRASGDDPAIVQMMDVAAR